MEISSEQLLKAAAEAERLTAELNRPMRVLGWYHSHPHITVCPSHVGMYWKYFLLFNKIKLYRFKNLNIKVLKFQR